jgi:hypothetical protein
MGAAEPKRTAKSRRNVLHFEHAERVGRPMPREIMAITASPPKCYGMIHAADVRAAVAAIGSTTRRAVTN